MSEYYKHQKPDKYTKRQQFIGLVSNNSFKEKDIKNVKLQIRSYPIEIIDEKLKIIDLLSNNKVFGPCFSFSEIKHLIKNHLLDQRLAINNALEDLRQIKVKDSKYLETDNN